jgi:N-acetylmuramoyl-L-alanine amidase
MLAMYGYGVRITGTFDDDLETVVAAFQRHFRPERIDGVADASTITTLRNLIAARNGATS